MTAVLALSTAGLLPSAASPYTARQLLDSRFDPRLRFHTVETAHFRVHYAEGLERPARHLVALAEPVHAALTSELGWEPKTRTDVVLVADNERTNAFTISYPTSQILINAAPPSLAQAIFHYGDWLRWLLVHEYTHVIHQDRVAGLSEILRPVLGTFAKPNMIQPPWLKEGIAVLMESQFDTAGRAGSTMYRMLMRSAERSGQLGSSDFGSLNSASYQKGERWPWILRTYLWGSALAQAAEGHSPGAIRRLIEASARGVPGLLSPAFRRAGLPTPQEIQELAVHSIRQRARQELADLARLAETPVVHLTADGYNKFGPVIDPTGTEIVYGSERPEGLNKAFVLLLDENGNVLSRRKLFLRQNGYQLSYSRSGRYIAFDDIDVYRKYYLWSDLFLFDREIDKPLQRSKGLRGRDADIHPDGVTIAFVQTLADQNRLLLCDSGFGDLRLVHQPDGPSRVAQPRWSPDGSNLVFIQHDEGKGGERLMLWDRSRTTELTDGSSQDRDPAWSPDGREILFSSDRGGSFQIYALDLESKQIKQVTHRYGGAFWPAPDPRGRFLVFLDYSDIGYDIVRMPWKPADWWIPSPETQLSATGTAEARGPGLAVPRPLEPRADDSLILPRPYSGWRYLKPSYLQPSIVLRRGGAQLGLSTGAVDPAFHQHYRVSVRRDVGTRRTVGQAFYYHGTRAVALSADLKRDAYPVENGLDLLDVTTAELRSFIPLGEDQRRRRLELGVLIQRYSRTALTQRLGGPLLRLERDRRLKQPNDLVPESGSHFSLQVAHLGRDGDGPVTIGQASAEKPMRLRALGPHGVLTVRLDAGWVDSDGAEYLLHAGGRDSFPFSLTSTYHLGGYEPNSLAADRIGVTSLRLTRPLVSVERGFATVPGYLDRVSLALTAELAATARKSTRRFPWSAGLELVAETRVGHLWPAVWTLGLYRGDPQSGGGTRVVLSATTSTR